MAAQKKGKLIGMRVFSRWADAHRWARAWGDGVRTRTFTRSIRVDNQDLLVYVVSVRSKTQLGHPDNTMRCVTHDASGQFISYG